jgi:cell division protein ZapA
MPDAMNAERVENSIDVCICGREYRVACEPNEREALEEAVAFVDGRMQEIADKIKTATPERVAVMAALNIAHEFLSFRASDAEGFDMASAKRRIDRMEARLDALLAGPTEAQHKLFEAV